MSPEEVEEILGIDSQKVVIVDLSPTNPQNVRSAIDLIRDYLEERYREESKNYNTNDTVRHRRMQNILDTLEGLSRWRP